MEQSKLQCQVAEKIYGKNKILKSNEYYLEQVELWKKELEKEKKNADAWFNFYRANRNAYVKGEEDNSQKSKGSNRFNRLKGIVEEMEKYIPNSFEYNFVKWLNGNNDLSLFAYLEKAHNLAPNNSEVLMHLIFYYEIKAEYGKRDEKIEEFYKIGDYSPGLLNYSYNMLTALEDNSIIFTEGDKDSEAILLLTRAKKFKSNVRMLNVNLLLIKEYRERVFEELGLKQLDFDPKENQENFEKYQKMLIQHISQNNQSRKIYIALTVSNSYTEVIKDDIYLTGLAYLYSKQKFDNLAILLQNVEQNFLLDYIQEYFPLNDISIGNVESINGNYVYPFAQISNYYRSQGNNSKSEYYKKLAYKLASKSDYKINLDALFDAK